MIDGHRYRPLYSADNEDTRSELIALEPGPGDTVIAVAAGGGRVLSLLTASPPPDRVIAIDRRADQIFNLELKAAALEHFDYSEFLGFLGIGDHTERLDQYRAVRPALSPQARRYWDRRGRLIRNGVFYAGRTERALIGLMQALRRAGRMRWAEPFFEVDTLESQRALLEIHYKTVSRGLLWWKVFCHPAFVFPATQDPSFLRSTDGSVGGYLARRVLRYASANLLRESFALRLLWDGRLAPGGPLPPYLEEQGYKNARDHLDRLELQVGDLRNCASRWRLTGRLKWSLSDVSCWMSERAFHELVRGVTARGDVGSRFCARNFAAHRGLPPDLRPVAGSLGSVADRLDRMDRSAIYTFLVVSYRAGPRC